MRYFLTGATGFIGGHVVRQLIADGHQVKALVRSLSKAEGLARLGAGLYLGDIVDKKSMCKAMEGTDGIFHLAAWYKVGARDRSQAETINVEGTRNVLELMAELEIPKGLYTSTLAVFSDTGGRLVDESYRNNGPWLSEYDRTKWLAHYNVVLPMIERGLPLIILQPGVVYGPDDPSPIGEAIRQYLRGRLLVLPQKTAFCWAHVADTARGHLLAMERGQVGESYIIAGPRHTFQETFEIAERITGIEAPRLHPSPATLKVLAAVMRVIGAVVPLPDAYTAESLRVVAGVTYLGDNTKARRELGFQPRSLVEGLQETLVYEMKKLGLPLPRNQ
ncbi:MAG TPA: NAD-dependent epimerase/dehydratase family protein [Terriglobia bacterium]|nr:NAD-dependent epimerase/dehydratase family protein [Terriglobia bacterium]